MKDPIVLGQERGQQRMQGAMNRADSIRKDAASDSPTWQKVDLAAPVMNPPPPSLTSGLKIPTRQLPPTQAAPDTVKQFDQTNPVPQRRVIGPTPL